jgi:hypothetical protein
MKIDKKQLVDSMGRPLTQSLFLEIGYDTEKAVFTLKDEDFFYEGHTYPSLKKLFLATEDPTEYQFAKAYLLGWQHWLRLNKNKLLSKHFEEWREELEVALRSSAALSIIDMSSDDKGFQAAKWVADKGWAKRGAGRPSKEEKLREERVQERIEDEFSGDVVRMLG